MSREIINITTLSTDTIKAILNTAMDNGDWHTPSASEIVMGDHNVDFINGTFRWHLHNGGSKCCFFQINKRASVHIADFVFVEEKKAFRPINWFRIYNCVEIAAYFQVPQPAIHP